MGRESLIATDRLTTAQRIWFDPTCAVLIFVGASAEFALSPYVDWLFFTGKLPNDPIERFVSTTDYLRRLLTASEEQRAGMARSLRELHTQIEQSRGMVIPNEGYCDVFCMDIYYSISAVPIVWGRDLTSYEKDEVVSELLPFGRANGAS